MQVLLSALSWKVFQFAKKERGQSNMVKITLISKGLIRPNAPVKPSDLKTAFNITPFIKYTKEQFIYLPFSPI